MRDENTFAEALRQQPFDSNRRWYDEHQATFHLLCACDSENVRLRQRIHQLEQQLQSAQLTPAAIADLGAHEILRCTREHYTLVRHLVGELRARQTELPEDLAELQGLWVKP
jgi:BMFP domain-containing protein YqiC